MPEREGRVDDRGDLAGFEERPDFLIKELVKFLNELQNNETSSTQISILVTGATDIVGSEIVRQLSEKEIRVY